MIKRSANFLIVILVLAIIFNPPPISASQQDDSSNISVEFHSSSVIREGNIFPASIVIRNLYENETLEIKKITILDNGKKIIKSKKINKELKSIKKDLKRRKDIREHLQQPEFYESPELIKKQPEYQEYLDIYSKIENETFRESFRLDIRDFDDDLIVGKIINVSIEIEFKVGNEKYVVHRERGVLFSEPLPSPPHNSPGWYVGDQHVHSNYGRHSGESDIDMLEDMVDAAETSNLDWLIFTDHSFALTESEWNNGYNACVGNSSSSFKCLYGQEMSIGDTGWCDSWYNSHYLSYPYTDDNLSYIDGRCGIWPYCNCRAEQPVMNEINNAGGIGFIAHPYIPGREYWWMEFMTHNWDNWSLTGFTGLEIINGVQTDDDLLTRNNPGGETDSWLEFLDNEGNPSNGFVVGIANSDAHYVEQINQTFTYCYLNSLSTANIRNAIKNGHCIASTGPFVEFTLENAIIGDVINVYNGTHALYINASSNSEFGNLQWLYIYIDNNIYGESIQLSGYSYSGVVNISLNSGNKFIRLEVYTTTSRRVYTNPIWINVANCSCGSWIAGSCGGGSCNSEQKQYTRTCTPSGCSAQTKCEYDSSCEEEYNPPPGGGPSNCTEPGYDQCIRYEYENCDVSIAVNHYTNVNNIYWGTVNDSWDPYVINNYTFGWKKVDGEQMYYDVNDPGTDGTKDCHYGGCDTGETVSSIGTKSTVNSPGTAHREIILGYDDTAEWACWTWFNDFNPRYGDANPIFVLNCFSDSDCPSSKYCDKSSSWSNWNCVNKKSNGQSCTSNSQCSSGYCDNDGVGLSDDNWCFAPYNTYFDGQETSYCEYSTNYGNINCDERQVGEDLNLCLGTSYYEEECSSTCNYQDIILVFECNDAGCSCSESLCDGLTTGNNITTCSANKTYFADECTSTAGGEDRGDNICRNSTFASDCTADAECGGIVAGTGNCSSTCKLIPPDDPHKFVHKNNSGDVVGWISTNGNIVLAGICFVSNNCTAPDDSFIIANYTDNTVAYIGSDGNLCIEKGDCSDQSGSCNPTRNAFIVRNASNYNMSYINYDGELCLIGRLYENAL